jgi:hypothetical protein
VHSLGDWEHSYKRLRLAELLGQLGVALISSAQDRELPDGIFLVGQLVATNVPGLHSDKIAGASVPGVLSVYIVRFFLTCRPSGAPAIRPMPMHVNCSEQGVRLAQNMQAGPRVPAGIRLSKAEVGPTSGPTRRLPHLQRHEVPVVPGRGR